MGSFDGIPSQSDADYKRWTDHMKMCCERTGGIFRYAGAGGDSAGHPPDAAGPVNGAGFKQFLRAAPDISGLDIRRDRRPGRRVAL